MHVDRRLFERARGAGTDLAFTIAIGVASGTLVVFQASYLSRTINGVFLEDLGLPDVRPFLLSYLAIAVVRSSFTWVEEIFAQRLASWVKIDLRATLTEHLETLGPGYVRGERTGELTHTIVGGVESLDAYLAQYLPRLARAAILPVVVLAFILPRDAISGVIMLVTAPLIPLFVVLIGSMAKARTRRQWLIASRMSARFLDLLQGLETLKLLGRSRETEETIRRASEQFQHATMSVLKVAFLSSLVLEMTATVSTALVAVGVGLRLLSAKSMKQRELWC